MWLCLIWTSSSTIAAPRWRPTNRTRMIVARAVSDPTAILKGLGEPKRSEVQKLYHSNDLTILNVIWAPRMSGSWDAIHTSRMYTGRVQRDSARWDSAALSTARVGFSQCSKHRYYRIALEFAAMRARIAYERLNELQRRRLIRRTSAHNLLFLLFGEHREVLHRLHISPTGQRFRRAWDVDVTPGALSAALEALTIACQLARVFDCSRRAPCKGHGHDQPYRQDARIFHRLEFREGCPGISIPEQRSGRDRLSKP